MNVTPSIRLAVLLALGIVAPAHAGDTLSLRLNADAQRGGVHLVAAEQSTQRLRPNNASAMGGKTLQLVGRDAKGATLFVQSVRDPRHLHAESFDPVSGRIQQVHSVLLAQQQFEVQLPYHPKLASVQITEQGQGVRANGLRLGEVRIEQIRQLLQRKAKAQAQASNVLGSELLVNSGPASKRLDIVIMGDGYTSADMAKWRSDANKVANGLLADPLFAANKTAFNIRRVDVVSAQSGIDDPPYNIYRNTALNATMACSGIDRLVCADSNLAYNAAAQVTSADGRDVILVVGNTTRYGGGGGYIATMTMHSAATELALHELGHTLFGLADEYDYGSCYGSGEPSAPNVTRQTQRGYIKWGAKIAGSTPLPTPLNRYALGTVGLFQGGNYCATGVYRPTENSKMRTLGYPWDAVNWEAASKIFATYKGDDGSTPDPDPQPDPGQGGTTVTGNLRGTGYYADHPNPYQYVSGGTITGTLKGPSNADFELHLYRWNGSAWKIVARSESPTSNESITYNASAGYYTLEVISQSGSGNYSLTYTMPK